MKLVCTDVETGGLDAVEQSLLSVAFCVVDTVERSISDEMEIVIKEDPLVLLEAAMKINKMTLEDIYERGVKPQEAERRIETYFQKVSREGQIVLLGHNPASLDIPFLRQRLPYIAPYISHRVVDTSSIARFLFLTGKLPEDLSSNKKLFDHFKIPEEGRHTALGDCLGTAKVFLEMMKLI